MLLLLRAWGCGKYYCGLQFKTSEERRHTLQICVSIGVPSRRVPGPIALLVILYGRVLMAVRQQHVIFHNIVVMQFRFQYANRLCG
jgi:hypothetical protein